MHTTPEERYDMLVSRTVAGAPFGFSEIADALAILDDVGRTPDQLFARAKELIAAKLAGQLRWSEAACRLCTTAGWIHCSDEAYRLPIGELLDAAVSLYAVERATGLLSMELDMPESPVRCPMQALVQIARRYAEAIEAQSAEAEAFAEMLVRQSGEYTRQLVAMDACPADEQSPTPTE